MPFPITQFISQRQPSLDEFLPDEWPTPYGYTPFFMGDFPYYSIGLESVKVTFGNRSCDGCHILWGIVGEFPHVGRAYGPLSYPSQSHFDTRVPLWYSRL